METLYFIEGARYELPWLQCTEYKRYNDKHRDRYDETPRTVSQILKRALHHINKRRGEDEGRLIQLVGQHCSLRPTAQFLSLLLYHLTSTTISRHIRHSMSAYKILSGPSLWGKLQATSAPNAITPICHVNWSKVCDLNSWDHHTFPSRFAANFFDTSEHLKKVQLGKKIKGKNDLMLRHIKA